MAAASARWAASGWLVSDLARVEIDFPDFALTAHLTHESKHSHKKTVKSATDMRLARVPCASSPRAMRGSARPGAAARPGRARRRGAASNPRRNRPPRREERADSVVTKVYMYAPVAVDRECAGRHPRHHAQVHVRLATCTATPTSVPFAEDPCPEWRENSCHLVWPGGLATPQP